MNITLTIEATSPEKLQEAIAGLTGITPAFEAKLGKPDKPKADKLKADKALKDDKPDPKAEDKPEVDPEGGIVEIVTPEALRAKAAEVDKAGKRDEIKALLDEFGSKAVSRVPKDRRAEFMERLEAL